MSYAKAIFPYHTGVIGDLDLQVDDVIEVLEQVDQNWLRGKIKDRIGLVPCKFVERLPTVNIDQNQSLYIAHTDYRSSHEGDLQFRRGDLLIVHEHLPNEWFRGSLHFDLPGTTYRPTGIFPSTFVTLIKSNKNSIAQNETQVSSSQNNLLLFDESPIKFVRVICDIKPSGSNELGCFEDEVLAVIENDINQSEWLVVKNAFNSIGRIKRIYVEPIDGRQSDDELNNLLFVPNIKSNQYQKSDSNSLDSIQELVEKEFDKLMNKDNKTEQTHFTSPPPAPPPLSSVYNSSQINYSQQYPSSLRSSYINSNNNNNILDVQSLYTSVPLNHFSTNNQYIFTSNTKNISNVCHTPSTTSSISSFDDAPPVKPRLSLRPQLPPPPPPPSLFIPTFPLSTPPLRGPTRPAPKPPIQTKISYRTINNPFNKNSSHDETISTRDSCDTESSSTRTDFFDIELQNLHNQLLIDDQVDKTDINIIQRRRQHAISELLSTERDYIRDLDLLIETFLNSNSISCPDSVNKKLLFGNIRDIKDLSHRLLNQLEFEYTKNQQNDDAHCCIGQIFNVLIDQLKTIYAEYCRNHEWVHIYIRKHGNDEKLQKYLQDGLCRIRLQKSNIFDVSALLLRPIQRIVRYPLILNELFKNTSSDHIDYIHLKEAISNLISMVDFINEYKRRKEIAVKSISNSNVTDDNMEPYHVTIFRRTTSMPPLPRLSSANLIRREHQQLSHCSRLVSKYQRREKDEALTNKLYKLNMHTMRKKSARISMRLSSAFGLSTHTIDERFNFEEQRFRAIDKFLRLFVRNAYTCMEALKETFVTEVNVAEDFQELLSDKMPDLAQQFVRSKRSLLENAFTEFCTHMESCVANPINTLIKLFVLPSNLISKRHDKLLDYDSAQSAYEKVKDQQSRQAKQVLDLAKKTYEALNSQLLEELPILYEHSCEILSICLKAFIVGHLRLIQHMRTNIQYILNQTTSPAISGQLSWLQIVERFTSKNSSAAEQLFQLTITAKNFSDKLKNLSTTRISSMNNVYNSNRDTYMQTDEIRRLLRSRYAEKDLYTVIRDYGNATNNRTTEIIVRSGDLVAVVNQNDINTKDSNAANWFVDNGINRGLLPRSILIPLSSNDRSGLLSHTPPTPLRHDIGMPTRLSLSSAHANPAFNYDQSHHGNSKHLLKRAHSEPQTGLINSSNDVENERIYLNQINECHQYASIDLDDSIISESTEEEQIYVAMYDFECTSDGVLSLHAGERLKILRRLDDGGNDDWWYVEKLNDTRQRGYVPANYIQAI
ncbi:unnamed protein product [Rotaria sp. Silwood2]|nr:unnamed protein product [Rotaria sp. Silwood2]CAF4137195.1 unnamed protein product [Rotaria sp. Silwood2]